MEKNLNNQNPTNLNEKLKERDVEVFMEWEAPSRSFKHRDKEFFVNLGVLVFAISLIFLFFKEFVLITTLWVVFISFYFFSTVKPQNVKHRITNKGVDFAGYNYKWHELKSFYFSNKNEQEILFLNTKKSLPGQIYLVITSEVDIDKLFDFLNTKLDFVEKPINTWFDQMVEKFSEKFSLE